MEHGQVRAILGRHARQARSPPRPRGLATGPATIAPPQGEPAAPDPRPVDLRTSDATALVPAGTLRRELEAFDAVAQRAIALDYVALWARTFRTLARHLRGRPERALALFAEEAYPYLRGDRRAARVERAGAHEARLLLAPDLPEPYVCGLIEGFVGLSGAQVTARPLGGGAFAVQSRVAPGDLVARAAQTLATLRLPLLLCALLAAGLGVAVAVAGQAAGGAADGDQASPALAVVAGVAAAQLGANALHESRRPTAGNPLGPLRLPRPALAWGAALTYAAAAACGWIAYRAAGPGVLAFAAAGLLLGVAYGRVRASGFGPLVAGVTYGLLVPAGAAYALDPGLASPLLAAAMAVPLGLAAAALLLLDNLADRPLDEAGGQRTLAVRLAGPRPALVVAGLALGAVAWLAATAWPWATPVPLVAALLLAPGAGWLVHRAWTHWDDPRSLGAARLAALALAVAVAAVPIALHLAAVAASGGSGGAP